MCYSSCSRIGADGFVGPPIVDKFANAGTYVIIHIFEEFGDRAIWPAGLVFRSLNDSVEFIWTERFKAEENVLPNYLERVGVPGYLA